MPQLLHHLRGYLTRLMPGGGDPETARLKRQLTEAQEKLKESATTFDLLWAARRMMGGVMDGGSVGWYGGGVVGGGTGTVTDRKAGKDLPYLWTEQDLRLYRRISRDIATSNPFAIGFLRALTDFHVGPGFGWQACLRGVKKTPYATDWQADPRVQRAQAVLDEFRDLNRWAVRSREAFRRWRRDGDSFTRLFVGGSATRGIPVARFVLPEQIGSPDGASDGPHSFGVLTDADDTTEVRAYFVRDADGDGTRGHWVTSDRFRSRVWGPLPEDTEPGDILHVRANVDEGVKRGLPDFLPVAGLLDETRKLVENATVVSALMAAIAWREKFAGATPAQIAGIVPQGSAVNLPSLPFLGSANAGATSITRSYAEAGTVVRTGTNTEYEPGPVMAGAGGFLSVEQAAIQACCVRWGLPAYFGGSSESDFAGLLVSGSPFVKAVEGGQLEWSLSLERPLALRVLRLAVESGRLSPAEFDALDVEVEPAAVALADKVQETQRREVMHRAGVMSATTWQLQEGLDPQHEQANFEKERAAGMVPGDDGGDPLGGGGGGDGFGPSPPGSAGGQESGVFEGRVQEGPPGPPPRPGLVWKDETHRWVHPETGEEHRPADAADAAHDHLRDTPHIPDHRAFSEAESSGDHEQVAAQVAAHHEAHARAVAATREKLAAAGATAAELEEFDRHAARHLDWLARSGERLSKAAKAMHAAEKAADAAEAEPDEDHPPEPEAWDDQEPDDEPDEPDVDDEPDREDYEDDPEGEEAFAADRKAWEAQVKAHAAWEKAHAEWEKDAAAVEAHNARAEAEYDKALEAWEKEVERVDARNERRQERRDKLRERADALRERYDKHYDSFDEAHGGMQDDLLEHVGAVRDRVQAEQDAADEAAEAADGEGEEDDDTPPRRSESRSGLVAKKVTRKDGVRTTVWLRPEDADHVPDRHPDHPSPGHVASGLAAKVAAAEPAVAADPDRLSRIADHAVSVAAKVYAKLQRATPAVLRLLEIAGAVLDTPDDLKKFGYNPVTSSGVAGHETPDPLRAHLGISTHLAATVATHVLSRALVWAKGRLSGTAESDAAAEFAALLAEALAVLAAEYGLAPPPDAAVIADHVRALAGAV